MLWDPHQTVYLNHRQCDKGRYDGFQCARRNEWMSPSMSLKEILRYGLSGEVNFEVSPILKVPGNHKLLLLIVVGVFGLLYSLLRYFTDVKKDSKEPPFIPQIIPYVGHLLGVLRYGPKYYDRIRSVLHLVSNTLDEVDS